MMCYPSIDSLIKKVDSQRARELTDGQPALIPNAADKKTVTIALEEIYNSKITYSFGK